MSLTPRSREPAAQLASPFTTTPGLEGRSGDELSFLLSSRRTRLSFQRTRMSADRTLMSVVRTALSLIGFGFTIFEFFRHLRQQSGITETMLHETAPRNFSIALVVVGVLMLTLGIAGHVRFMAELRADHEHLEQARLIPHDSFPYSITLAIALLLLLIGLLAVISMVVRAGPFL